MMNREEAKHLSDVLKAYSEGKKIQKRTFNPGEGFTDWVDTGYISFYDVTTEYRIKPEHNYRPYANAEEFLKAQKEHGVYIVCKRDNERVLLPIIINKRGVEMYYSGDNERPTGYTYNDLLKYWQHQDGTPCGMMI